MATKISSIYTLITADDKPLKRGLVKARGEAVKGAKRIQNALNKINFRAIGLGLAAFGGAVAYGMKQAVDAASDLEEATGKFSVVFRDQLGIANEWARELVAAYGLSELEAKKFLSSIQDLLKPMGVASDEAARLSNEVVKLAVDLGSFNNVRTEDVIRDIQSALVGNFETMKKYGVVLNVARIRQEALNSGLITGKEVLTAAQRATMAYRLIVQGSADAIGDWHRTQGSLANQMKQLQANITNISSSLGNALLPKISETISGVNDWIKANKTFLNQDMPNFIGSMAGALGGLVNVIKDYVHWLNVASGNQIASSSYDKEALKILKERRDVLKSTLEMMKLSPVAIPEQINETKRQLDFIRKKIEIQQDEIYQKERSKQINKALLEQFKDIDNAYIKNTKITKENVNEKKDEVNTIAKLNKLYIDTLPEIGRIIEKGKAYRDSWEVKGERTFTDQQIDKLNELNNAFESLQSKRVNDELNSMFNEIDNRADTTFQEISKLSERTAWSMQENFSNVFFDAMKGELKSLKDYATAVFDSILRAIADVSAQMVTQGLFGKDFKGGGWISAFGNMLSGGTTRATTSTNTPTVRGGEGGGYGFQHGGYIGEPVKGFGTASGKSYEFHPNEFVTPANQMGGGVKIDVNVVNNLGQEAEVKKSTTWVSPDQMVAEIVLNKKLTSRGFRQSMRA